jgi:hypothetical protein
MIMGDYPHLGKFIPLRTDDLVDALCAHGKLSPEGQGQFRRVAELIQAIYHFEFHEDLKRARRAYHIFNPDADTLKIHNPALGDSAHRFEEMVKALESILVAANYRELTLEELNELMTKAAPRGLNIQVNHEKYEKILIYRRGKQQVPKKQDPRSKWKFWGHKEKEPEFEEMLQRLLILIKLKSDENVEQFYDHYIETAGETERQKERRLLKEAAFGKKSSPKASSGSGASPIFLKIFKNVPVSALETLFPDVTIQMTLVDKGMILLPLLGGLFSVVRKVIPALLVIGAVVAALMAGEEINWVDFKDKLFPILAAFSLVGIISVKVFTRYKNTKEKHQAKLMKTLYFHNLDNNAGVFNFLVHEAEEEECKETLLAYYFLLTERTEDGGCYSEAELDDRIEEWIASSFGKEIDFEVDDALRKLQEKQLLVEKDGRFEVPSMEETLIRLDTLWDEYFLYSQEAEAEVETQTEMRAAEKGVS